jgi:hypothetical protein
MEAATMDSITPLPAGGFSVADLCRRWKIGGDKIRTLLRRGELVGINVATDRAGKPQWRVTAESVQRFEQARSSAPPPPRGRHRPRPEATDYYPNEEG